MSASFAKASFTVFSMLYFLQMMRPMRGSLYRIIMNHWSSMSQTIYRQARISPTSTVPQGSAFCLQNQSISPARDYNSHFNFLFADVLFSFQDYPQASFSCTNRRGGALLSLPVEAQRQDTRARGAFGKWMLHHIDSWLAFTRRLGLGIEQMEEIVLVTGCHLTRSWANVTFLEGQTHAQASFGINVTQGRSVCINWHFSLGNTQGVVCSWGPEGPVCQFAKDVIFQKFETDLSHPRTYQRTNVYLSAGSVLFAFLAYSRGSLEGRQDPIQVWMMTKTVTNQTRDSYQYLLLPR